VVIVEYAPAEVRDFLVPLENIEKKRIWELAPDLQ
jgi:hypothetical protein